ncbi:MAG: DUF2185 domain-containing protein [Actinomycetaceae bacterium]|nr:DUF2185 domain-containing protein [Actinomycetaceae bacterium]
MEMIEFILNAGACITSLNVIEKRGRVRWMDRGPSVNPADNGWRIFSELDTSEYLSDPNNMVAADFNAVCNIEPALIGIYDFPMGSQLEIVRHPDGRIAIVDSRTGREIPREEFYVPEAFRR